MESLPTHFEDALQRIEVGRNQLARNAHLDVRRTIERSAVLKARGVDTVLIGSYARDTSIYPGKDVDVFCKMTKLDTATSPKEVYETLYKELLGQYGKDRIDPQRRSVKVKFIFEKEEDEFWVDAVPAVRSGGIWAIPTANQELWTSPKAPKRWLETDPEQLMRLTTEANRHPTVNDRGAYVPTVKLIKQIREHHVGGKGPGGLYHEIMTYWAFQEGVEGECFAEILAAVLQSIAKQIVKAASEPVVDPVLERSFDPLPTAGELLTTGKIMADLAKEAEKALQLDRCGAAVRWRKIIGRNGRGWCFTLPDGCDELGNEIRPIASALGRGPKEAHGFG